MDAPAPPCRCGHAEAAHAALAGGAPIWPYRPCETVVGRTEAGAAIWCGCRQYHPRRPTVPPL